MSKDTKKEEKKPVEVKKPEVVPLEQKKVAYSRGGKDITFREGGENGRRK